MTLLRVADYVQIQAGRAPKELLKVKTLRTPIARREWSVHRAVANIAYDNPDPEALRIQVDTRETNLETFLRLREWQLGIQHELDISWAVLGEVYGRYSTSNLNKLGLSIRRIHSDLDDVQAFAKRVPYVPDRITFSTADAELLQLLIRPLYGDHPEVGVRELIQNAVDAVLELENHCERHGLQRASFSFAEQMADVTIQYTNEPFVLKITDKGIGMNISTVRDYFLTAGASFRRSDYWKSEYQDEGGQSQINRSGRFGVGLLAAFLLGSLVRVTTRHVSESSGITFTAGLDTDAIELTRVECPVGTSIEISLSSTVAAGLTPDRTDWYFLTKPHLLQLRDYAGTIQETPRRWTIPGPKKALPCEWRRLNASGFADVQWTFSEGPELVCNGIEIRPLGRDDSIFSPFFLQSYRSSFETWHARLFRYPSLSVFDPNGNLPLTMTRDRIATSTLPFDEDLAREVIADFIAYCLVTAPDLPLFMPGRKPAAANVQYPGFPQGRHSPPYWVQTANGSVLADPALLPSKGGGSIFLHGLALRSDVPQWVSSVKALPQMSLRDGYRYSARTYFIKSVLYNGDRSRSVDGLSSIHFTGARYLLDRKYAESWNNYGALRASTRKEIIEVWKNKEWVVWQFGNRNDFQVDLKKIAASVGPARGHGIVCAEKLVAPRSPENEDSSLITTWKGIIGDAGIPYNRARRRKIIQDADKNVRGYVARWKRQLRA